MIYRRSAAQNPASDQICIGLSRVLLRKLIGFRSRRFVPALSLVLLLAPASQASLDPQKAITQFIHQSWQSDQGLPENSVTAIAQTKDGYLWLGTEGGLVRFDGLRFTTFEKSTTPGLGSNFVTSLLVDHEGTLWIGTYGGGLTCLREGRLQPFSFQKELASQSVLSLYEDRKGNLWIGTDGGGIARFHQNRLDRLTKKNGLADDSVLSISGDGEGTLWKLKCHRSTLPYFAAFLAARESPNRENLLDECLCCLAGGQRASLSSVQNVTSGSKSICFASRPWCCVA